MGTANSVKHWVARKIFKPCGLVVDVAAPSIHPPAISTAVSMASVTLVGMVFEVDSSAAWNEMFSAPGKPRPIYERLFAELGRYQPAELRQRSEQLSHTFSERGVTFAHSGEERPFPLDVLPRLIGALEWDGLSRGIAQRVHALEAFLADIYG